MQFKLDERGSNLDFLALVMKDPSTYLPVTAKEEKKEVQLMMDAPVFNPKNAHGHPSNAPSTVQPARSL